MTEQQSVRAWWEAVKNDKTLMVQPSFDEDHPWFIPLGGFKKVRFMPFDRVIELVKESDREEVRERLETYASTHTNEILRKNKELGGEEESKA